MSRKNYLVPLLFVISSTALADNLNLNTALEEFNHSPKMQKSVSAKEEASWKKTGTMAVFLPHVYFNSYHRFQQKYAYQDMVFAGSLMSIPSQVPATVYSLGFEIPLFDGFANINKYQSAKYFEQSAVDELDWTRFSGEREVIVAYYKALAANSLLDVANQNYKALEDHLSDVQLFKKAGLSTKFDVLRVEVQKSEAQSEVLNAQDNLDNAINRLGEVLGVERESRKPVGELPVIDKSVVTNVEDSITNRSDINSLRNKVSSISEVSSADGKFFVPKISLIGEYQKYNNRNDKFFDSYGFRNSYYYAFALTWDLFDGMKSISKDRVSEEQKIQAEKSLKILEIKSKNDYVYWKRKFNYFSDVIKARSNDIDKAEESVRLAKEGRKVGTRTNTDLLDAEAELYRAKAASVNAKLGAVEALVNLELATGKKIYNFN